MDLPYLSFTLTKSCVSKYRGLVDFDQPVAKYWPEFSKHNKGEITVRDILSEQVSFY